MRAVDVEGEAVLVTRSTNGELCAIASTCSHFGGPLAEGEREGDIVVCPWHGSRFDVCTGKVRGGPASSRNHGSRLVHATGRSRSARPRSSDPHLAPGSFESFGTVQEVLLPDDQATSDCEELKHRLAHDHAAARPASPLLSHDEKLFPEVEDLLGLPPDVPECIKPVAPEPEVPRPARRKRRRGREA